MSSSNTIDFSIGLQQLLNTRNTHFRQQQQQEKDDDHSG